MTSIPRAATISVTMCPHGRVYLTTKCRAGGVVAQAAVSLDTLALIAESDEAPLDIKNWACPNCAGIETPATLTLSAEGLVFYDVHGHPLAMAPFGQRMAARLYRAAINAAPAPGLAPLTTIFEFAEIPTQLRAVPLRACDLATIRDVVGVAS